MNSWSTAVTMYMQQNNNVMFNLLDSHDTERLMNRFHSLDIFYQQLAVLFTMPGSPCIFYGKSWSCRKIRKKQPHCES